MSEYIIERDAKSNATIANTFNNKEAKRYYVRISEMIAERADEGLYFLSVTIPRNLEFVIKNHFEHLGYSVSFDYIRNKKSFPSDLDGYKCIALQLTWYPATY